MTRHQDFVFSKHKVHDKYNRAFHHHKMNSLCTLQSLIPNCGKSLFLSQCTTGTVTVCTEDGGHFRCRLKPSASVLLQSGTHRRITVLLLNCAVLSGVLV